MHFFSYEKGTFFIILFEVGYKVSDSSVCFNVDKRQTRITKDSFSNEEAFTELLSKGTWEVQIRVGLGRGILLASEYH